MGSSTYRPRNSPEIDFTRIARKIGLRLREVYAHPESEQLPVEQVQLLLRLRHKERERGRQG